jgi:hypothetical protein
VCVQCLCQCRAGRSWRTRLLEELGHVLLRDAGAQPRDAAYVHGLGRPVEWGWTGGQVSRQKQRSSRGRPHTHRLASSGRTGCMPGMPGCICIVGRAVGGDLGRMTSRMYSTGTAWRLGRIYHS